MKETYHEAMQKVFIDEGGYTNDAADPGGPTNWGITIHDARMYWKPDATAADVRAMPKDVAEEIYAKHYANPIRYDDLPPGVDYAVLDYGINSGISRSAKVLQRIVGAEVDGIIGPKTVAATAAAQPVDVINAIYAERLGFLQRLRTWPVFGRGWARRCKEGRALALALAAKYSRM
jgi:lysozyme family protein